MMQQRNVHIPVAPVAITLLILLSITGCTDSTCRTLSGRWSTREGQSFYFQENGHGLWLVRFGSKIDTFPMAYRYDCGKQPIELDLSGFETGPLAGKTLFGILEWNSDTSFRFDAEAGTSPTVRPSTFESDQTQKFFIEKE
ncbi:MAG: hypothetical protein H6574_20960 [Lewinellaceae bacterium]|nr:hypothetical protein [Saprospiraceae bacterium]MCB9333538.1 hypothetical protein [Lewinellaceae bacterium]